MNGPGGRSLSSAVAPLAILGIGVLLVIALVWLLAIRPDGDPLQPPVATTSPALERPDQAEPRPDPEPGLVASIDETARRPLPESAAATALPESLDPNSAWFSVRTIARIAGTNAEVTLYSCSVLLDGRATGARPASSSWGDAVRSGRVLVKTGPGEHELTVQWGGKQARHQVVGRVGEIVEVDLVLEAPASVSGRAVDAFTGAGIENALVDVDGSRGSSGPGGAFTIPCALAEDGMRLVHAAAWHEDYWPTARQPVEIGGASTVGLDIVLRPASAELVIEVRDRAGAPLRDVPLRVVPLQVRELSFSLGERAAMTGPDGTSRVRVPARIALQIAAGGSGVPPLESLGEIEGVAYHIPESTVSIEPLFDEEERLVSIEIGELWVVDVRVPAGLVLEAYCSGQRICRSLRSRDERVVPISLPDGDYRLVLSDGTMAIAAMDVNIAGPSSFDLTYEVAAPISGQLIVAPESEVPGGIGLEAIGVEDDLVPASRIVPIDEAGRFRFDHLPPGRYRVVPPEGYALESSAIVETSTGGDPPQLVLRALGR